MKNAMEIAPAAKPHPLVEELCGVEDEDLFTPIDIVFGGRSETAEHKTTRRTGSKPSSTSTESTSGTGTATISSFRASDRGETPRDSERSWKGLAARAGGSSR